MLVGIFTLLLGAWGAQEHILNMCSYDIIGIRDLVE